MKTDFKEEMFDEALYSRAKQNYLTMADRLPSLLNALSDEGLPTTLKFLKDITKTDTAFYDFLQAEKEKHLRGSAFIPKDEIQRTNRVYNDLYLQLADYVSELRRMFFSGLPVVEVGGAVAVDAVEIERLSKERATTYVDAEKISAYWDEVQKVLKAMSDIQEFEQKNGLPSFVNDELHYMHDGRAERYTLHSFLEAGAKPELFQLIASTYFKKRLP